MADQNSEQIEKKYCFLKLPMKIWRHCKLRKLLTVRTWNHEIISNCWLDKKVDCVFVQ